VCHACKLGFETAKAKSANFPNEISGRWRTWCQDSPVQYSAAPDDQRSELFSGSHGAATRIFSVAESRIEPTAIRFNASIAPVGP
jgi:hypothetical protein